MLHQFPPSRLNLHDRSFFQTSHTVLRHSAICRQSSSALTVTTFAVHSSFSEIARL
ncbi:hypothetical protein BDQ94DRAFT_143960 [Aspergillus welwitschiae]|uniref:Uncharacterized protein n=1 Tax=Aspergillus welwitschiae TaxID=1341132 RepID=A0A3F3Q2V3_9EURO|nr:hypothetical protein BDQ94DRAFT_143960 [Aspergillus welwitschiae]RDH33337.1 hypothetical protein BDQ94DRAFT_143960 [Aspergillus welwitschiae]